MKNDKYLETMFRVGRRGWTKSVLNRVLEIGVEGGYSTRGTRKGLEELRGRKKLCPQSEVSKIGV